MFLCILLLAAPACANTEKQFLKTRNALSNERWLLTPVNNDNCISPFGKIELSGSNSTVCLRGLKPETQYEVRVCWPATTPGDYTFETNPQEGWIRVLVKSSGVLKPGLNESLYNNHRYHLIIEDTLFGVIPLSAIPVIALCIFVLSISLYYVVPAVHRMILSTESDDDGEFNNRIPFSSHKKQRGRKRD